MTDDESRRRPRRKRGREPGPADVDPHHALNTPVDVIDDDSEAMLYTEDDEGERLEGGDDRAEDERESEGRTPTD